jgi:hypothetical protein
VRERERERERERMIIDYVAMVIKILVFVSDIADINYCMWLCIDSGCNECGRNGTECSGY